MNHFIWRRLVLGIAGSIAFAGMALGFEPNDLPPTVSTVKPTPVVDVTQITDFTSVTIPDEPQTEPEVDDQEVAAREADIAQRETKLAEREKAVEEREKAVAEREAALNDWYTNLSEYREYLHDFQVKSEAKQEVRQTVVRPTYAAYSYGNCGGYAGSPCANGQCYGGWQ